MPPAARLGDLTSHGTPLAPGPGSPTVLIGGMPAWTAVADLHACPLVTVLVPHVGGVVALGSLTVLIEGMPAARMGDVIVEAGPPNAIAIGCPTVMIGD
jgi:uncharacterized Zn-binding protein involved in type VI secretion